MANALKTAILFLCAVLMTASAEEFILVGTPRGIQQATWTPEQVLEFSPLTDDHTEWMAHASASSPLLSTGRSARTPPGELRSWLIKPEEGQLQAEQLSAVATTGKTAIYVTGSPNGKTAWVCNFRLDTRPSIGSLVEFDLENGVLQDEPRRRIEHPGRGKNSPRQDASHPHSVAVNRSGTWLAVGDLGIDAVVLYRLDSDQWILPDSRIIVHTGAGSGPRHVAFHPQRPLLVFNTEQTGSAGLIDLDGETPALIGSWKILPSGGGAPADLVIHPQGHRVYVSVRGPDRIAVLGLETDARELVRLTDVEAGGTNPRAIQIHPSGSHLLSANRGSHSLAVFSLDPESGLPATPPTQYEIKAPTSLLFLKESHE